MTLDLHHFYLLQRIHKVLGPLRVGGVTLEEIRIEKFHQRIKVISEKNVVLIVQ